MKSKKQIALSRVLGPKLKITLICDGVIYGSPMRKQRRHLLRVHRVVKTNVIRSL